MRRYLTVRRIHAATDGVYGVRRVHAEPSPVAGRASGTRAVAMPASRLGLRAAAGPPHGLVERFRALPPQHDPLPSVEPP